MMISPEGYYEFHIKGKSIRHIKKEINELRKRIKELKNKLENPNLINECLIRPSPSTQLWCCRLYLEKAIEELIKRGNNYKPSEDEKRIIEFNKNIPYITKIEYNTEGYSIDSLAHFALKIKEDKIEITKSGGIRKLPNQKEGFLKMNKEIDKEHLFEQLKEMYIGEWINEYTIARFDPCAIVEDGTNWELIFHYSNGCKPRVIRGHEDYPYNFSEFLELIGAKGMYGCEDYFDEDEEYEDDEE